MLKRTFILFNGAKIFIEVEAPRTEAPRTNIGSISHRSTSIGGMSIYHIHSLWLFTSSDIKTIIGPSFLFGATNALASARHGLDLKLSDDLLSRAVLQRLPLILLYLWMNFLPFTVNNQRSSDAIKEDEINKPWRTLPSGRMKPHHAERLMYSTYLFALGLSSATGGLRQSIALVFLGTWYNNFAGGDSFLARNLINALGYVCFTSGAMEVALGRPLPTEVRLVRWFVIIAAVIFTTVHLQDMYDQAGDNKRGRKTLPLVIGDGPSRWTIAIPMIFWGYVCPYFWDSAVTVTALGVLLASTVAARSLMFKEMRDDRLTFKMWNAWMTLVFLLPLLSQGIPWIPLYLDLRTIQNEKAMQNVEILR